MSIGWTVIMLTAGVCQLWLLVLGIVEFARLRRERRELGMRLLHARRYGRAATNAARAAAHRG
jgi:hypothetical protein